MSATQHSFEYMKGTSMTLDHLSPVTAEGLRDAARNQHSADIHGGTPPDPPKGIQEAAHELGLPDFSPASLKKLGGNATPRVIEQPDGQASDVPQGIVDAIQARAVDEWLGLAD